MAVRYRFQTSDGAHHDMRMLIPSSTDEKLRGEHYDQASLDWLHDGQKHQIERELGVLQRANPELKLERVWTVEVDEQGNLADPGPTARDDDGQPVAPDE